MCPTTGIVSTLFRRPFVGSSAEQDGEPFDDVAHLERLRQDACAERGKLRAKAVRRARNREHGGPRRMIHHRVHDGVELLGADLRAYLVELRNACNDLLAEPG